MAGLAWLQSWRRFSWHGLEGARYKRAHTSWSLYNPRRKQEKQTSPWRRELESSSPASDGSDGLSWLTGHVKAGFIERHHRVYRKADVQSGSGGVEWALRGGEIHRPHQREPTSGLALTRNSRRFYVDGIPLSVLHRDPRAYSPLLNDNNFPSFGMSDIL